MKYILFTFEKRGIPQRFTVKWKEKEKECMNDRNFDFLIWIFKQLKNKSIYNYLIIY